MLADVEVEVLRDRELPALARAGLAGAAGRELTRARGPSACDRTRCCEVSSDCVNSTRVSLNSFLPIDAGVAGAQRVGDRFGAVGALLQIEVADAEIAARVVAARELGAQGVAAAEQAARGAR